MAIRRRPWLLRRSLPTLLAMSVVLHALPSHAADGTAGAHGGARSRTAGAREFGQRTMNGAKGAVGRARAWFNKFQRLSPRAPGRAGLRAWLGEQPAERREQLAQATLDAEAGREYAQLAPLLDKLGALSAKGKAARKPALVVASLSAVLAVWLALLPATAAQGALLLSAGAGGLASAGFAFFDHWKGRHETAKLYWGATAALGLGAGAAALLPAGLVWSAYMAAAGAVGLWSAAQAWGAHRLACAAEESALVVKAAGLGALQPASNRAHRAMLEWVEEFAGVGGDFSSSGRQPLTPAYEFSGQAAQP